MGVMSCSRKDCDNIVCDTYVQSVGYVCYECQSEFKEHLQRSDLNPTTDRQIRAELEVFMSSPKDDFIDEKDMTVDEFFSENTR